MNSGITKVLFSKDYSDTDPIRFGGIPHTAGVCSFGGRVQLIFHNTEVYPDGPLDNYVLTEAIQAWESPDQFSILLDITAVNVHYVLRHVPNILHKCVCGEHANPDGDVHARVRLKDYPYLWEKLEGRLSIKPDKEKIMKYLWPSYKEALASYDKVYLTGVKPSTSEPDIMEASVGKMLEALPDSEKIFPCPVVGCSDDEYKQITEGIKTSRNLKYAIMHLNDSHKWTREDIADWLELESERQGFSLAFPDPEV